MRTYKKVSKLLPISTIGFERILNLSDGVFAIIITLMVIELKVPQIDVRSEDALAVALMKSLPTFISLLVSFLIIGMLWVEHHRMFRFIKEYDFGLLRWNLAFLGVISFIPFPTSLFAEYPWSEVAYTIYALTLGIAGYMKVGLLTTAWKHGLIEAELTKSMYIRMRSRSFALPLVASFSIFVTLATNPMIGAMSFLLLPGVSNLLARHGGKPNPMHKTMSKIHSINNRISKANII